MFRPQVSLFLCWGDPDPIQSSVMNSTHYSILGRKKKIFSLIGEIQNTLEEGTVTTLH
jgi:hypothetical protein